MARHWISFYEQLTTIKEYFSDYTDASKMEILNNQLANYALKENQARSPAFQHWDNVLESIHRNSVHRMLSNDLQVEFQLIIYHKHPLEASPLVLKDQFPSVKISTAGNILEVFIKIFRKEVFRTIQYDILNAPFYFICQEEVESYDVVVAKHSTKLVGEWFERNVRFGQEKLFQMAVEMKCYEGECKWVDEEMTLRKLMAPTAPCTSKVTGE